MGRSPALNAIIMKNRRVKTKRNYEYSRIGTCHDCLEEFGDMVSANEDARKHTEMTGHTTSFEVAVKFTYEAI